MYSLIVRLNQININCTGVKTGQAIVHVWYEKYTFKRCLPASKIKSCYCGAWAFCIEHKQDNSDASLCSVNA